MKLLRCCFWPAQNNGQSRDKCGLGIREQISPTILAVATLLVILSIVLLTVLELLRRRSERLRGITPS